MSSAQHPATTAPEVAGRARGRAAAGGRDHDAVPPQRAQADGDMGEASGSGTEDDSPDEDAVQQEPDALYDEAADDKDAAWVEKQRSGRVSDAVLSCPGCFTTLCIDCQRHEKYHHQYRAMFVMNCKLGDAEDGGDGGVGGDFDPTSPPGAGAAGGGRGGRRPKRAKPSARYRRVLCSVCDTEVGAYEAEDELYHFYHVFPSNA